ncbi:MAG: hypothetical protein J4F28_09235 [Nitrosopumilaceae archaeon]|nr:hypothetical protein [Nitrosopumilaceae archaeon]
MITKAQSEAADASYGDATKFVLANGTYDLGHGEFTEGLPPGNTSVIRYPITYDEAARCPVFDRVMDGWFSASNAMYKSVVMEMFGICMLRIGGKQKMYVHHGSGSNGKSTCLLMLRHLLGAQNTAFMGLQALGEHQFVGDMLRGKLANIGDGDCVGYPMRTKLIEAVLDGGSITCRGQYGKPRAYRPFCTMVFAFNDAPPELVIPPYKVQLVPWTNKFEPGDTEIATLPFNEEERSGLFNRLVPEMRRLLPDGGQSFQSDD